MQTFHGALAVYVHRCQDSKKAHAVKNLSTIVRKTISEKLTSTGVLRKKRFDSSSRYLKIYLILIILILNKCKVRSNRLNFS